MERLQTPQGSIAYRERGSGPVALFVHGVFLNSYYWRHVIDRVCDLRRCVAIDLLAHGATEVAADQDVSFGAQAEMLGNFCDELGLDEVDLVGSDSGGGIAQIFAARYPRRLRTLTLTNCDVHDNWPPEALKPLLEIIQSGGLGELGRRSLVDPDFAREQLAGVYQHPENVSEETIRTYFAPLFSTPDRVRLMERWFTANDNNQTVEIENELRRLDAPTLVVWGTGDIFFDVKWAYWLCDLIPGAKDVVEVPGGRLLFPEERPDELALPLRNHWNA
jgi:pimeloyl-ACP methyl ester carboxylesterase